MRRAVVDTSVMVAAESGRRLDRTALPDDGTVSIVTVAELRLGVLVADDHLRAPRLATLERALTMRPLSVDASVAERWAQLRATLRAAGRRMPVNDSWIAATALAHGLPVVTQDDDYDDVPGLTVIKV